MCFDDRLYFDITGKVNQIKCHFSRPSINIFPVIWLPPQNIPGFQIIFSLFGHKLVDLATVHAHKQRLSIVFISGKGIATTWAAAEPARINVFRQWTRLVRKGPLPRLHAFCFRIVHMFSPPSNYITSTYTTIRIVRFLFVFRALCIEYATFLFNYRDAERCVGLYR